MSTQYVDINKNDDFIFLNPISQNVNMPEESIVDKHSTSKDYNSFVVPSDLLQISLENKLRRQRTRSKFQVLQKWEGVVEQFDGVTIHVRLSDLTSGGTDEEAELDIQDVSADDHSLVKEGAMFYWSIGYETQLDRQVRKSSFIKFKRLPKLVPNEFDLIHDRAKELESKILLD